jgi:hypothetical protein
MAKRKFTTKELTTMYKTHHRKFSEQATQTPQKSCSANDTRHVTGLKFSVFIFLFLDYRDKRDMKTKNMFLTRMCMGDICIVDKPLSMKRPPCKSCLSTICDTGCRNTKLFDSVLVDGQWLFREMIVYDHSQCYPEYLISYQRVK